MDEERRYLTKEYSLVKFLLCMIKGKLGILKALVACLLPKTKFCDDTIH